MTVTTIRRPRYARRTLLQWVQNAANALANENHGKVPDIFLIDARLRRDLDANPDMLDRDKFVRDVRRHWERASNKLLSDRAKAGGTLFVPGAYVALGKRVRGRMTDLDPITDGAAWMQQDQEAVKGFMETMNKRRAYQLQIIDEGNRHRECNTLGELETKLRGFVPSSSDAVPFDTVADGDDEDDK